MPTYQRTHDWGALTRAEIAGALTVAVSSSTASLPPRRPGPAASGAPTLVGVRNSRDHDPVESLEEGTVVQYALVGACLYVAMLAFWKGDAMLGFGILGASVVVYWLMVEGLSLEHLPFLRR